MDILELLKTITEHLISSDTNINLEAIILLVLPHGLLDEDSPQKSLAIEVQNLWHFVHDALELLWDRALINSNKLVDQTFIFEEETDQVLNSLCSLELNQDLIQ